MQVSFYTTDGNKNLGWDVIKKTFPSSSSYNVAKETLEHHSDQISAVGSAKKIANASKIPFVHENIGVMIIAPLFGMYVPTLLTPEGGVLGQGKSTGDIEEAIKEALEKAEKGNYAFVPPQHVTIYVDL